MRNRCLSRETGVIVFSFSHFSLPVKAAQLKPTQKESLVGFHNQTTGQATWASRCPEARAWPADPLSLVSMPPHPAAYQPHSQVCGQTETKVAVPELDSAISPKSVLLATHYFGWFLCPQCLPLWNKESSSSRLSVLSQSKEIMPVQCSAQGLTYNKCSSDVHYELSLFPSQKIWRRTQPKSGIQLPQSNQW